MRHRITNRRLQTYESRTEGCRPMNQNVLGRKRIPLFPCEKNTAKNYAKKDPPKYKKWEERRTAQH